MTETTNPSPPSAPSHGLTWGTIQHLFSIYLGLVAGTVFTAVVSVWAGVVLIVLDVALMLWLTFVVPDENANSRTSSGAT